MRWPWMLVRRHEEEIRAMRAAFELDRRTAEEVAKQELERVRTRIWSDYYEKRLNEMHEKLAREQGAALEWRRIAEQATFKLQVQAKQQTPRASKAQV